MFKLLFFALVLCGSGDLCSSENLPEVDTPLGRVRGFWDTSYDGRKFAAFEGIPYAKPPVADLRFEDPSPVTPWIETWEANNPHTCLQSKILGPETLEGNEDCLYLNVYFPVEFTERPEKLDVVVAIHGGGYMAGSGHSLINANLFMDRDIVLVTINYRLGLFGFLSTGDGAITGNFGLKDQSLSLKWVKDNIASFGGNTDSITIIGLSAGGGSVHLHYFSPLSRGLFHKGMSQSGTALAPWSIQRNPIERTRKLAGLVGCTSSSTEELKQCLKQRPAENLVKQVKDLYGFDILPLTIFAPVIENGASKPFLDKEPYLLLKEGNVIDVPWITSFTADDGLLPSAMYYTELDKINQKWEEISRYFLDCNYTLPESKGNSVIREVLDYYLGPGESINKKNFKGFTQMFTDRYFGLPAELAAKMQTKVNKSPVYFYVFNYKEGENKAVRFFIQSEEVDGVSHGDECFYQYGLSGMKPFSEQDTRLKDAFHDMVYKFASTGKPSFDDTDVWQPTGSSELTYLNVSGPERLILQTVENLTPIDFWSKLGFQENENIIVKDEL